jgi:5-methylcytosine-specific restriction endonuclease McrA
VRRTFRKRKVLRLDSNAYADLRQQVLERDGWRCQRCGSLGHLEVHHQQLRSRLGEDMEKNLITLCASCHRTIHN